MILPRPIRHVRVLSLLESEMVGVGAVFPTSPVLY